MLSLYAVPMLITAILCIVLTLVTWLLRHQERIHRVFSLFSLFLALDATGFFLWFQFGDIAHIDTWMRYTFTMGMLVPLGMVVFFFAFTGYDRTPDKRVLGIKARWLFRIMVGMISLFMVLSAFTDLFISIPDEPTDIWDVDSGIVGSVVFFIFAVVFIYLFTMAWRAYRSATTRPERRFILLLTGGTLIWIGMGYIASAFVSTSSAAYQFITYLGTSLMVVVYFIAILNHQADKLQELNVGLEQKVANRTRHLEETRTQLVQSEKMAALGHLVAGVAHEMNTPVGAIYSTHATVTAATKKLRTVLRDEYGVADPESAGSLARILRSLDTVSGVIRSSGARISDTVKRLKLFARLDEAELQQVDLQECVANAVAMFEFHLKPDVQITTDYADLPPITCYPAQISQLVFQLLKNANLAIEGDAGGTITVRTGLDGVVGNEAVGHGGGAAEHDAVAQGESTDLLGRRVIVSVADTGRGMDPAERDKIFNPGYTNWALTVGTGLGLAIGYQIAQDHHGTLTVSSDIGRGSTFTLSFPADLTAPDAS